MHHITAIQKLFLLQYHIFCDTTSCKRALINADGDISDCRAFWLDQHTYECQKRRGNFGAKLAEKELSTLETEEQQFIDFTKSTPNYSGE